jgi:hypothetical protein
MNHDYVTPRNDGNDAPLSYGEKAVGLTFNPS